jgi:hypothetical protein
MGGQYEDGCLKYRVQGYRLDSSGLGCGCLLCVEVKPADEYDLSFVMKATFREFCAKNRCKLNCQVVIETNK